MPEVANFVARYVTPCNKPLTRHCRETSDRAIQGTLYEEWSKGSCPALPPAHTTVEVHSSYCKARGLKGLIS